MPEKEEWVVRRMGVAIGALVTAFVGCFIMVGVTRDDQTMVLALLLATAIYAVLCFGAAIAHLATRVKKLEDSD